MPSMRASKRAHEHAWQDVTKTTGLLQRSRWHLIALSGQKTATSLGRG